MQTGLRHSRGGEMEQNGGTAGGLDARQRRRGYRKVGGCRGEGIAQR